MTDLYRYFDADGRLLYVGISLSAVARAVQHRANASWWTDVATMTREVFPTRNHALDAERTAIQAERPLHNVVHNGAAISRGMVYAEPAQCPPSSYNIKLPLLRLPEWHAAAASLDSLAKVLDLLDWTEGDEAAVPSRDEFIQSVSSVTRSLVFGSSCDQCDETRYPAQVVTEGSGYECTYFCPNCSVWFSRWWAA